MEPHGQVLVGKFNANENAIPKFLRAQLEDGFPQILLLRPNTTEIASYEGPRNPLDILDFLEKESVVSLSTLSTNHDLDMGLFQGLH